MKINPDKFKVGKSVDFGGTTVKYSQANERVQISLSEAKIEELLGRDPPKTKKELQSILGSLNQLSQWVPNVKIKIPLMRKLCEANNHCFAEEGSPRIVSRLLPLRPGLGLSVLRAVGTSRI